MSECNLTQSELKELVRYNPETGGFTWLKRISIRVIVGKEVGNVNAAGYRETRIKGNRYYMHRLAWLYMTGKMPTAIDHINRNRSDNRWINLRDVPHQVNMTNCCKRKTNKSGHPGVWFCKKTEKFHAYINHLGKRKHLGSFNDFDSAVSKRKEAEVQYGYISA